MRSIDFEQWKRDKVARRAAVLAVDSRFQGRAAGRRPRDPKKEKILLEMDIARRERYIQSGKLEIISPRRWKWRIDFK